MVSTIKFSQFAAPNLSATNNMLAGVGSGANFKVNWPLSWTTALRPITPKNGTLGYNTDLSQYEYWDETVLSWVQLSAGGIGTVSEVDTGVGLTGGPITTIGTISFAPIAANSFWANTTGVVAVPTVTSLPLSTQLGGTGAALTPNNGGIVYSSATAFAILAGIATANHVLMSGATSAPTWSVPTYPNTSGTAGQFLASDGTNIVFTSASFPVTVGPIGTIIISDGTNWIASTSLWPNTVGAAGKILQSDGTTNTYSTPTWPTVATSTGSFVYADGTNFVSSTSLWPNTVGTVGKILRSDGTTNTYSTATFADTYTASNLLYSNGANTVQGLTTANNGVLITDATGVPSILVGPGFTGRYLQSNAAAAPSWSAFIPASSGVNADITSMTGLTGTLKAPTAILDTAGLNIVTFGGIASAVNYVEIRNNSTTNAPLIDATGSDATVALNLRSKGNIFQLSPNNATGNAELRFYLANGTSYTGLKAKAGSTSVVFMLPAVDGSANFIMKTDGAANLSLTNGSQIAGTATNDSATAGNIGEFVTSNVPLASSVTLTTTATDYNVTSISLTAGDWDVWGNVSVTPGTADTIHNAWCSTTSATIPDSSMVTRRVYTTAPTAVDGGATPYLRVSAAGATTVYLSARATFTGTSPTACGSIFARRAR